MTREESERRPAALELRLAYLLPLPASAVGATLAGLLAGLYLLARWRLGPPLWISAGSGWGRLAPDARDVLVALAAAGFIVAAIRQAVEGNARDLRAAAKHGGFPLPRDRPPTSLVGGSALRRARWAAVAGALVGGVLGVAADPYPDVPDGAVWGGLARAALVGMGAMLGRAIWFTVETTRDFDRLARVPVSLDLLDPTPLYRLGRIGLRLSFTWVVGLTLFSFLTLFGASPGTAVIVTPVLGVIVAVAGLALILPVRTLHARIRATRARELARLRQEVRRLHRTAQDGGEAARSTHGRIADLCALEERVAAVREWPFELSTLLRFALYLLIPVGSWFAGALVERLVSSALD